MAHFVAIDLKIYRITITFILIYRPHLFVCVYSTRSQYGLIRLYCAYINNLCMDRLSLAFTGPDGV